MFEEKIFVFESKHHFLTEKKYISSFNQYIGRKKFLNYNLY